MDIGELKIRAIIVDEITKPLEKISRQIDKMSKTTKTTTKGVESMSKTFRGFNASLLSVMFGSQQLSKTFDNLLSPVEDAIGLQEYWNAIMIENTIDAIDPAIDALEVAGEAFEYMNNVTGGTLGQMFLFGRAVGDTMGTVSQATLFLEGLVTQFINLKGGGSLAADAIAQIGGVLAGILIPITFFNERNLIVAKAFLTDINDQIENVVAGQDRQKAAIKSLDEVLPTLHEIFLGQQDIETKINDAKNAVTKFADEIESFPKVPESTITSFDTTKISIDSATSALDILKKGIDNLPAEKNININITWELFKNLGLAAGKIAFAPTMEALTGGPYSLLNMLMKLLIPAQKGGIVPGRMGQPMPILAHGGETIIPAGGNVDFSPTVYINATLTSPMDIRAIGDELLKSWQHDLRRLQM